VYRLLQLEPSEIDLSSRALFRFRFSLPHEEGRTSEDEKLISSVEETGVINPPLLVAGEDIERLLNDSSRDAPIHAGRSGNRGILLLCGFRRVSAARAAGLADIDALLVENPRGLTEILRVWLKDAASIANLSDIEKVTLAKKLYSLSPRNMDDFIDDLSSIFGRTVTPGYLQSLFTILDCDHAALIACHRGILRADELLRLKLHPEIDETEASALLTAISATSRERKEIIRLMEILAGKEPGKLKRFLERRTPVNVPAGRTVKEIRRLAYPTLSSYEERISALTAEIGLPTYARLTYPENLEGPSYTLTVRFRREEELAVIIEKLDKALSDGTIGKLLAILRGEDTD